LLQKAALFGVPLLFNRPCWKSMELLKRRRKGYVPPVGNAQSNNNTIALIKGKLTRAMPKNTQFPAEFERMARRIISKLRPDEKLHWECKELPDENGNPFKFYLIGE
jgi:hypothetical protein